MKDPNNKHECNLYLNKFFNIAKSGKELDIIKSSDIQSKCVLIENKGTFYSSTSLDLKHHSLNIKQKTNLMALNNVFINNKVL